MRTAASEGEANAALLRLFAGRFGVSVRDIGLVAGAVARIRQLRVGGVGPVLAAALEKISAIG